MREVAVYKDTLAKDCEKMLNGEYYTVFIIMNENLIPIASVFESAFDSAIISDTLTISSFAKNIEKDNKNQ